MSESRVCVIMANFNGANYIEAAVGSVLSQGHTAIELIVVDDGSQDDSVERLQKIAAYDPRLKIVHGQKWGGPAAARNEALRRASGEWVAVVDSDDYIRQDR